MRLHGREIHMGHLTHHDSHSNPLSQITAHMGREVDLGVICDNDLICGG